MGRKILKADRFQTGYGTHKYVVEYEGKWGDMELITAIDNKKWDNPTEEDLRISHFGGCVKRCSDDKTAIVHVYYD